MSINFPVLPDIDTSPIASSPDTVWVDEEFSSPATAPRQNQMQKIMQALNEQDMPDNPYDVWASMGGE